MSDEVRKWQEAIGPAGPVNGMCSAGNAKEILRMNGHEIPEWLEQTPNSRWILIVDGIFKPSTQTTATLEED